jgi:predicted metal-dependent phosphoesterase TrpH
MKRLHTADLHMHTYYSDGRASPRELLEHAAAIGLKTVAITDHDNARGTREAQPIAKELGLELIPAMEFSCYWPGYTGHGGGPDIDVLGYFMDLEHPRLKAFEETLMRGMLERAEACCAHICRTGRALELQDVLAKSPHYTGFLALADTLASKHGLPGGEAHEHVDRAWKAVGAREMFIGDAIALIHEVGGVAVLAHPSIIHRDGVLLDRDGMADLVEMGLDGIEVLHYRLNDAQREHFAGLARAFDLPITGGSDEHGWPDGFPRLGSEPVTLEMVATLRTFQKVA